MKEARSQQDDEQWHLFIIEDLLGRRGDRKRGFFFGRLVPQLLALASYHLSWLLYASTSSHEEESLVRLAVPRFRPVTA